MHAFNETGSQDKGPKLQTQLNKIRQIKTETGKPTPEIPEMKTKQARKHAELDLKAARGHVNPVCALQSKRTGQRPRRHANCVGEMRMHACVWIHTLTLPQMHRRMLLRIQTGFRATNVTQPLPYALDALGTFPAKMLKSIHQKRIRQSLWRLLFSR